MPKGAAVDTDDTFESVASGASETVPKQCSALRKNEACMIKGKPCKIVEMTTSKTGKHGHAKVHLTGLDIFDGKKYEDICPSTHNMNVPVIKTTTYTLTDVDEDGFLALMDESGNMKENLKLPENDLGQKMKQEFDDGKELLATVTCACGREEVTGCKQAAGT